jgi:hypothetical protein
VAAVARKAAAEAAQYAEQARQSANQAAGYAAQAVQSAQQAAASAAQAAESARVARNAANSASQAAESAFASAQLAQAAAAKASAYATSAFAQAEAARASALAAGKDAQEAARLASEAVRIAVEAQRREAAAGPPDGPPLDRPQPGMSSNRLGNELLGNNLLAKEALEHWGGQCEQGAKQIICVGVRTPNGRPMTIGDYLLYPNSRQKLDEQLAREKDLRAQMRFRGIDASTYGPDLLEHEARHSDQWQHFPPPVFLFMYFWGSIGSFLSTGDDGDGNPWEIGANPYKGGYWKYGPAPSWWPWWLKPLGDCAIGLCW